MAKAVNKLQNIVLRKGVHVGAPAAEDDQQLLMECFIELASYEQIRDINSSKCVLLGRTGSGKSALLLRLEEEEEGCIRLDPKEFAFSYISNSNVLSYVMELGCDLHLLFEFLWKHVLLYKMVKVYFKERNKFQAAFDLVFARKNPAIKYLQTFEDKFWIEQDIVVKEISQGFESTINSELRGVLGADFAKIEAGAGGELTISSAQRKQIEFRVKRAVSQIQMKELSSAVSGLDTIISDRAKRYYILVDDLDGDWSETPIKYQMIRSLVESIKGLRKIRNIKAIVALRSDVYEKSIVVHRGDGYQPEKYEGLIVEIRWSSGELRSLIDRRITAVFRHQYTKENVRFSDVFPAHVRKQDSFQFLIDRTQLRPRDIIAFVNSVLEQSSGSNSISEKRILETEGEYSRKRYDALRREWELVHPNIDIYLRFLIGRTGTFLLKDIAVKEIIDDICVELEARTHEPPDEVEEQRRRYCKRQLDRRISDIARALLATLYKIGAIELKLAKGDFFKSCFRNETTVLAEQISDDAAVRVVPMLWRTLGITPNI